MDKYIKWELKDYFKRKKIWFIIIGIVYFLSLLVSLEGDGFFSGLIVLLFAIIVFSSLFGAFFIGTRRVLNTFKQKTFLLESMIPLDAKKILLAKYILGIIINFLFSFIGILGISIILLKDGGIETLLKAYKSFFENLDFLLFLRVIFTYLLSVIAIMSISIFGDVLSRIINPNGKGNRIISTFIILILFYTYTFIAVNIVGYSENIELITDLVLTATSIGLFFLSSWLIENKLEIYN